MEEKRQRRDQLIKAALSGKSMQQQEMRRQSLQEQNPTLSTMRGGGNSTQITWRTQDGANDSKKRQNAHKANAELKAVFDKKGVNEGG